MSITPEEIEALKAELAETSRRAALAERRETTARKFWLRDAKEAIAGKPGALKNRIELCELPPVRMERDPLDGSALLVFDEQQQKAEDDEIAHLRAELARVEAERDDVRRLNTRILSQAQDWRRECELAQSERDAAIARAESARREALEEVVAFCAARDRGTPDAGSNAMRFIASHFGTMARALLDAHADGK